MNVTKKVLVFSDFDSIRQIIINALKNKGYEVNDAKTYDEAKALLNGISYGLIITDNDIKNQAGIKLVTYMRELTSYLFTPVMLIHSHKQEQLQEQYTDLKIACFLNKPFDMQKFFQIVERLA